MNIYRKYTYAKQLCLLKLLKARKRTVEKEILYFSHLNYGLSLIIRFFTILEYRKLALSFNFHNFFADFL